MSGPAAPDATADPSPVCATCGALPQQADADTARVTWTRGTDRGRTVWTCLACSRRHLRSIEGKLDPSWW